MYGLIIDTTTKYLTVVIAQNDFVLASYNRLMGQQQGKMLIPVIEKLLKKKKMPLAQVDYWAVNQGPGSFTGLRIGIAAIKGLGFALNKKIVGFSGLEAMAIAAGEKIKGLVCPIIDAKRKQVYSAVFRATAKGPKQQGKYFLGSIEDLIEVILRQKIFDGNREKIWFSGDGLTLYKDQIIQSKLKNFNLRFIREKFWYPEPKILAKMCFKLMKQGKTQSSKQLQARYLYKNTCTISKKSDK
ncbi:MAG: tRNA (adenosine(37)-N6)-threonylcarbamoyltransferase complex dimerization subunit type 1 TsaB [Candidatus Omnitrophota bacterium]